MKLTKFIIIQLISMKDLENSEKYNTGLGEFVDEPATINLKGLEVLENLEELSVGIEHKIRIGKSQYSREI